MKTLFLLSFFVVTNAFALQPVALICGNGTTIFQANFDGNKKLFVSSAVTQKPMWAQQIKSFNIKPGFESIPPKLRVNIDLQDGGKISALIIDRLKKDSNGSYKEGASGHYNGPMSGNENHEFNSCELQYE